MIDLGFEEEIRNTLDHYRGRFRVGKTCFFLGLGSSDLWPGPETVPMQKSSCNVKTAV